MTKKSDSFGIIDGEINIEMSDFGGTIPRCPKCDSVLEFVTVTKYYKETPSHFEDEIQKWDVKCNSCQLTGVIHND